MVLEQFAVGLASSNLESYKSPRPLSNLFTIRTKEILQTFGLGPGMRFSNPKAKGFVRAWICLCFECARTDSPSPSNDTRRRREQRTGDAIMEVNLLNSIRH